MKKLNNSLILVLLSSFAYCACDSFEKDFLSNKREGDIVSDLTPVDRSELGKIARQAHTDLLSGVDAIWMNADQRYAYLQDTLWSFRNAFSEAHRVIKGEAARRRALQMPFTEAEYKSFSDSVYREQNVDGYFTSHFHLQLKAFARSKGFGE